MGSLTGSCDLGVGPLYYEPVFEMVSSSYNPLITQHRFGKVVLLENIKHVAKDVFNFLFDLLFLPFEAFL